MRQVTSTIRNAILAALLLAVGTPLHAQDAVPWNRLTPQEQQALKPFESRWQEMSPERQQRLRQGAARWQQMSPEEKQRARDRYQRFKQLPPAEQERLRAQAKWYRNQPPEERHRLREQWRQMSPEQRKQFLESRGLQSPGDRDSRPGARTGRER